MEDSSTAPGRWTSADWLLIGLLVLLAAGIRVWQLAHTEVAARDSIGFIRVAWQFRRAPLAQWPEVVRHAEQHPVYPLAVLAASKAVRHLARGPESDRMRLSTQLASAL